MSGDTLAIDFSLELFGEKGDTLTIISGLTAGYGGEGPMGTLKILRDAGFDVDEEFIITNSYFDIKK